MEKDDKEQDCAICLQNYHHPAQLPCGHVFCFLCVKGIAILSKKCAICRTHIPSDYFDHPVLLNNLSADDILEPENEKYHWYYEGRNGWWKYDERSNVDLESAYNSDDTECQLLLAGTLYCVDFQNMIQFRRTDPTKRRRVKRDVPTLPSKGIAGIKNIDTQSPEDPDSPSDVNTITIVESEDEDVVVIESNISVHNIQDVSTTADQPAHTIDELADSMSRIVIRREDLTTDDNEPVLQNSRENV